MSDLSERLRELRGVITQKQLARALSVSPALVSGWENGIAVPPLRRLKMYAELFGVVGDGLLDELILLGKLATKPESQASMLNILQDIRWVLIEIRDRLPPKG